MKNFSAIFSVLVVLAACMLPFNAQAEMYRIEVLQVTQIGPFDASYQGFVDELEKNGIVEGKNLTINRTAIDFDVEKAGLWKKMGVLMRIKKEASRIADARPDLVLTIGTPATKYAKDKIVSAGIPLVFTGVAIPEAAGCRSVSEAGPGFTGATLYMEMTDALKIINLAFPRIKTLGMVYSDDDNAIAQEQQARERCPAFGMNLISKEVEKSDPIAPAAEELIGQGAAAFVMPLDSYYGLRDYEPCVDLGKVTLEHKMPMISLVHYRFPGFVFYVGADFAVIGSYSGKHAVKILKEGAKPGDLPILKQEELTIMVDTKVMQKLGIELPLEILQLAKSI